MTVIGTQQSPIEIDQSKTWYAKLDDDFFRPTYSDKPLAGHFAEDNFIFDEFESITVGGEEWTLRRIHFHDGAEHILTGRPQSHFEVHLVHSKGVSPGEDPDLSKNKLVIGAFFSIKARLRPEVKQKARSRDTLKALNAAIGKASKVDGKVGVTGVKINPLDFLPEKDHWGYWFHYEGSLTSGKFSEDVSWYVYRDEAEIARAEIDKLRCEAKQHVHPVQQLNRRLVIRNFEALGKL